MRVLIAVVALAALTFLNAYAHIRDPFAPAMGKHIYVCSGLGEIQLTKNSSSFLCVLIAVDGDCYCVTLGQMFAGHRVSEIFEDGVSLFDEFGKEHRILFQKKGPST